MVSHKSTSWKELETVSTYHKSTLKSLLKVFKMVCLIKCFKRMAKNC